MTVWDCRMIAEIFCPKLFAQFFLKPCCFSTNDQVAHLAYEVRRCQHDLGPFDNLFSGQHGGPVERTVETKVIWVTR